MKRIIFTKVKLMALFLFVALMAACTADVYEPDEKVPPVVNPDEEEEVPSDFAWSLNDQTELIVNIENIGKEKFIVAAYIGNPAIDKSARMLPNSLQRVSKEVAYKRDISIPKGIPSLYLSVTDSRNRTSVYGFDVTEGNMVCTIGNTAATTKAVSGGLRSMTGEMPAIDYSYADKLYEEISGDGASLRSNQVYVIPKGRTLKGTVSLPGEGNFQIYVEGTWDLAGQSFQFETGSNLYVLNGGEVKNSQKVAKIRFINNGGIAVQEDGEFGDDDESIELYLTNDTRIVNEGEFDARNIQLDSNAKIYNSGDFDTKSLSTQNEGNYILNKHEFEAEKVAMTNGTIDNYCKFEVDKLTTSGAMTYINLAPAAFMEVDELVGDHLHLFMDAKSYWKGEKASFSGWDNLVQGGSTDFALFKVERIKVSIWNGILLNYSGMVNIECKEHTNHPDAYNPCYKMNDSANFSKGQGFVEIDDDDCNNHNGNHNPGEDTGTDDGGDITEPSTLPSVYLFEDNWPAKGDYDMNDIVMSVALRNTVSADGKVKAVDIDATLYAVGATKKLAVAFQLNNVPASAVAGSESDQKYAVVRLFDDAHAELGYAPGETVNTFKYDKNIVKNITKHIDFTMPLDNGITAGNFNLFVVWGDMESGSRNEIHIPGFRGTDRAAASSTSTDRYISTEDGWMWGLCIPLLDFGSYPKETIHIGEAYSGFDAWLAGQDTPTWYMKPVEGKVIVTTDTPEEPEITE